MPSAALVCVLALVVISSSVSSSPTYDLFYPIFDWENALLPCTCDNGTVDCSYRRKTSIQSEDVCDVAPVALNLYNNLFVSFPDGFLTVVSVNASWNRLSALPLASQLNQQLTVLDLSRNEISNATNELRELSSLQTLDLKGNQLSHLRFLPQSCDLKRLDVSHNSIVDLEGPLNQCTQLKELNLKNNKLVSLSSDIFSEMSQLEVLNLADNSVGSAVTSNMFDNLPNLKTLDLYNIQLTSLPRGIFKSLSKLEKLDIGLNDLSSLSGDIFSSLVNLKSLGMIRGNMQTIPTGMFSSIPQLEDLFLSVNFFTALPSDAFSQSHNLKILSLDFLNATSLPGYLFTNLTELQTLTLYGNLLTSLPEGLLLGLIKLEKVDISANLWTELPLQHLRNVKQLYMGQLRINSLGPRMFSETPRVNMLFVYSNNISFVAENAFEGLALEGLSIANNALTELSETVFQAQVNLKYMDLSYNMLVTLPQRIFFGLHQLLGLELSNNKLQSLPDQIFHQLSALQYLDLSDNELTAVGAALFADLRSLRSLSLDKNRLTVLPSVPLARTAPLHVSLADNAISRPDERVLRQWLGGGGGVPARRVLDLSGNGVSPAALRWLLGETQMRLESDARSPCDCGFVRQGLALLRVCANASCPASWADALRSTDQ